MMKRFFALILCMAMVAFSLPVMAEPPPQMPSEGCRVVVPEGVTLTVDGQAYTGCVLE